MPLSVFQPWRCSDSLRDESADGWVFVSRFDFDCPTNNSAIEKFQEQWIFSLIDDERRRFENTLLKEYSASFLDYVSNDFFLVRGSFSAMVVLGIIAFWEKSSNVNNCRHICPRVLGCDDDNGSISSSRISSVFWKEKSLSFTTKEKKDERTTIQLVSL